MFKIQNRYYVNKDEWMEIQDKDCRSRLIMDRGTMYQMEAGVEVKRYYPDTEINRSNHLLSLYKSIKWCFGSHFPYSKPLKCYKRGIGGIVSQQDRSLDDAPFEI